MTFQEQIQSLMTQAAKIKPSQKERLKEAIAIGHKYQFALQAIAKLNGPAADIAKEALR